MLQQLLRQLKDQSKLTAQEMSQRSGIPLPTVHKLLSGETTNPKYDTLKAVVGAFNHQVTIIPISEKGLLPSDDEADLINHYQDLSDAGKDLLMSHLKALLNYEKNHDQPIFGERSRDLPLYVLAASAGIGNYLDSDQYDFKSFPAQTIPAKAKYAIRVTGHSMEPVYYQNDIVFVEPVDSLHPGDVGIIVINGDGFIKQYQKNEFLSFNPSYDPILPSQYDEVRIVGRVVGRY